MLARNRRPVQPHRHSLAARIRPLARAVCVTCLLTATLALPAAANHLHFVPITDTRWPENDPNDPAYDPNWVLADSVGPDPLQAWVVYSGLGDDITITDATQTYSDATGDAAAMGIFDQPFFDDITDPDITAFVEIELVELDSAGGKTIEFGFTDLVNRIRVEESEEKLSTNVLPAAADFLGFPRFEGFGSLPLRVRFYYHFRKKLFTVVLLDELDNSFAASLDNPDALEPFLNFFSDGIGGTDPDNLSIYFYVLAESQATVRMSDWGRLSCPTAGVDVEWEDCGADLEITQTNGVSTVTPGEPVTYVITASNLGVFEDSAVHVQDTFPSELDCTWTCSGSPGVACTAGPVAGDIDEVVALPPGSAAVFVASCMLDPLATGILSNTATISGTRVPEPLGNNSSTDSDVIAVATDLAITKSDKTVTAVPGESVTYALTATNLGPTAVVGATVTDSFPLALNCEWECIAGAGASCTSAGTGDLNDSVDLSVGATASYFATCAIDPGATGSLLNTATIAPPSGVVDPISANNTAFDADLLTPQANLSITKDDGVSFVEPGDSLTYVLTATNHGPSDVSDATVSDLLPPELVDCSWICSSDVGALCTAGPVDGDLIDSVDLPAGLQVAYALTCTVDPEATIGLLVNEATFEPPVGVEETAAMDNVAMDVDAGAALVFFDGFESGTTGAWIP